MRHAISVIVLGILSSISAAAAAELPEATFNLRTGAGYDSNALRLSTGQADASAMVRPSLTLRYALTRKTSIWGTYTLGMEKFASSSILNTTSHQGEVRLMHHFSSPWSAQMYGLLGRSNQPQVLTTRPGAQFATFTQGRVGLRLTRTDGFGGTFGDYFEQRRRYTRLVPSAPMQQRDSLRSMTIGRWHRFGPRSYLMARAEFLQNRSNDPIFRYTEPGGSLSYVRDLGSGYRLDLSERARWLKFASRPISVNPSRTRSDLISTSSIGIRKDLTSALAVSAWYALDRDFSNEPVRRFTDHRVWVGFDFNVGSRSRPWRVAAADPGAGELTAAQFASRGYDALEHRQWNDALRLSLEAIRLDPALAEAHTNAGIAYYKLGRRDAAIAEWKASLALRPANPKVRNLLLKMGVRP